VKVFGVNVEHGKHQLPSGRSANRWFRLFKQEYLALQQAISSEG
jgi:hypothetical protein